MDKNERAMLVQMAKNGVTGEFTPFSMQTQMDDLVLHRERKVITKVMQQYRLKTMLSRQRWMKKMKERGYIEVDYTNQFHPLVRLTEKGSQALQ